MPCANRKSIWCNISNNMKDEGIIQDQSHWDISGDLDMTLRERKTRTCPMWAEKPREVFPSRVSLLTGYWTEWTGMAFPEGNVTMFEDS